MFAVAPIVLCAKIRGCRFINIEQFRDGAGHYIAIVTGGSSASKGFLQHLLDCISVFCKVVYLLVVGKEDTPHDGIKLPIDVV